jgi:tRNA uridine 5-carboxymethylaminomethyl modification enzyme
VEVYVNGFSTSLPERVQFKAIKQIPGFEHVKMFRPGYAIEYDYFPPTQLSLTLETKLIQNLYFAGQINGTTGYEEAGCQGLMAGINAHLKVKEQEPLILKRSEAYIGVLIDDLITKGTEEPYRMFTSRAEYRLLLRQDNADLRLSPLGHKIGLATDERLSLMLEKKKNTERLINDLNQKKVGLEVNSELEKLETAAIKEKSTLSQLIKRPNLGIMDLANLNPELSQYISEFSKDVIEQAEIQIKFQAYIDRELKNSEKIESLDQLKINAAFNYNTISALSAEAREKLLRIKPETLGQASRISGVSPADVSILLVHLGR